MQRVLRFGTLSDWQEARRYYGLPALRRAWRQGRNLDAKSREFWRVIFGSTR